VKSNGPRGPIEARFNVKLSSLGPFASGFRAVPGFCAELEQCGVHGISSGEHLVFSTAMSHPGGVTLPHRQQRGHTPDPFFQFVLIAEATSNLRVGISALIAALHEPVLLARQVASLNVVTDGRFDLGITGGWFEPEFAAVGVPFEERFARLEESIKVCRTLWNDAPATFHGRFTSFDEVSCAPEPVSPVPVLIGGGATKVTARRVAELSDGWIASEAAGYDVVAPAAALIYEACEQRGRDVSELVLRATLPRPAEGLTTIDEAREPIHRLAAEGVTDFTLTLSAYASERDAALDFLRALIGDR
jgi:probable F420-dependent oxidoreductase